MNAPNRIETSARRSTLVRTPLIPARVTLARTAAPHALDHEAICVFAATGFFLEADSYYRDEHALLPATEYELDADGVVVAQRRYWSWHHDPREISLDDATDEFGALLETSCRAGAGTAILPLSGGLDSRSLAAALAGRDVRAYSYSFEGGFAETEIACAIARAQHMPFTALTIRRGYLWRVLDEIAAINGCQTDFTHPRQIAVIDEVAALGDHFVLGHWGDVLFDGFGLPASTTSAELLEIAMRKFVRRGGMELAQALWTAWQLPGDFASYLRDRLRTLLDGIAIRDPNARLRAFKSLYWAPRWTSANLAVFESRRPIVVPYYDDLLCKLICTLPESLLAGRAIQLHYLKTRTPRLARIPWQTYYPLDLYDYPSYGSLRRMPVRAWQKLRQLARERLADHKVIQRNWELQLQGDEGDAQLYWHLFGHPAFRAMVPRELVMRFYRRFRTESPEGYAHAIGILLTLSQFARGAPSQLHGPDPHATVRRSSAPRIDR